MFRSVILAAGYGTRMSPLTDENPKPLLPEVKNSMLLNQITFLRKYKTDIIVTIGYQKQKMLEALKEYNVTNYIYSENKGNAFWINKVKIEKKEGPFVVITSDNLMDINLDNLIEEYYNKGEKSMIVSTNAVNAKGDKIKIDDNKNILGMKYETSSGIIASGLQLLNLHDIKKINSNIDDFHDVWNMLIKEKRLILSDDQPTKWISVDTVEDLKKLLIK